MDQHDFFDQLPLIVPVPEEQLFLDLDQLQNGLAQTTNDTLMATLFLAGFSVSRNGGAPSFT